MKRLLLVSALALLSGCANLMYHSDGCDGAPAVYRGTREDSRAVAQIFVVKPEWHSGSRAEAMYAHAACVLLSPVLLVDWPFEVVADTLTLPYDIYKDCTR